MTTIAYLYSNPLLETAEDPSLWGLEVDRVYQDLGARQQLQQLIEDCQENPPNYLLIRRLEELGDSLAQINQIINLIESLQIEIIAVEQAYNSSQFQQAEPQKIKDNLSQLCQEIENKQRNRRLREGHARNRLKALPPPGRSPYGYRRGKDRYLIDRTTAPVVKDFFERFLLFGSLRDAVRYLERKYGKKIAVSTGRHWLTNPVYRGDLCYQNNQLIPNTHVPIISREEAAQIDRLLRRNRTFPSRSKSAPRSLAGLVRCQHCQSKMKITSVTSRNKQQKYLYLTPLNCVQNPPCQSINYQRVLNKTIEHICQELPPAVAKLNLPSPESLKSSLQAEITSKKAIIKQLAELVERGILDNETAQIRAYNLSNEIAHLQTEIAKLPPVNLKVIASAVSIPQFWLDLSETERRFYFREFIREIVLVPPEKHQTKNWQLKLVFIF
jgi:DNA invertase Pin-like site-specific DNA recombinase